MATENEAKKRAADRRILIGCLLLAIMVLVPVLGVIIYFLNGLSGIEKLNSR
jgi:hypothetical protein